MLPTLPLLLVTPGRNDSFCATKMTGLFQNGRNKVLFFHMKGWFLDFSSLTSSMFLIKLAKNLLAYSKNDGHEEKGTYC